MPIEEYTQEFVKETLFRYDNVFDPGERASIASYHEEHHGSGRDLAGIDRLLTTLTLFRAVAVSRLAGTSEGRTETKTRDFAFQLSKTGSETVSFSERCKRTQSNQVPRAYHDLRYLTFGKL